MSNIKYTITLSDGSVLDNLTMNGNNFISKYKIDKKLFENNCSPVTISDGTTVDIHEHMDLVQISILDNEYWFSLRDLSFDEIENIRIWSAVEYLSMMLGIDI